MTKNTAPDSLVEAALGAPSAPRRMEATPYTHAQIRELLSVNRAVTYQDLS